MFLVVFDVIEDIKKVHQMKTTLSTVVKVEPIKASKLIPKNVCGKPSRCAKCGGKHSTTECSKAGKEPG